MKPLAAIIPALLPFAAHADGGAALRACMAGAGQASACIGRVADACTGAMGAAGETTAGMVQCIALETDAWDALLNESYRDLVARFREADAAGDVLSSDLTRVATLRSAQRAWIVFRDAECLLSAAQWGAGSLGRVASANCIMSLTAERTIDLMSMQEP